MDHQTQWFNEQRWRTRVTLSDLLAAGATGVYRLGLVGTLGFVLAGVVQGYEEWSVYGLVGTLLLSGVARVVRRQSSHTGYRSS